MAQVVPVSLVAFSRRIHLVEIVNGKALALTLCRKGFKHQGPFGHREVNPELVSAMLGDPDMYCRICVLEVSALVGPR